MKDKHISDKFIKFVFLFLFFVSTYILLYQISSFFLIKTPVAGGSITEGVVGVPISFNPLFASNEAEQNVSVIIYGGLLKKTGPNTFIKELASSFESTKDLKKHTFKLKKDLVFHDGKELSGYDFLFTVERKRQTDENFEKKWEDITITIPTKRQIIIESKNLLSKEEVVELASIKIIPKHIWQKIPANLNASYSGSDLYVGSGPFLYKNIKVTQEGVINSVKLTAFDKYILGSPYLKEVNFVFFKNKEDLLRSLKNGNINSVVGVSPLDSVELLSSNQNKIVKIGTNKVFGLFFNHGDGFLFSDQLLRSVFANIDIRSEIIDEVLLGYANPIYGPDKLIISDEEKRDINIDTTELNQTLNDFDWVISEGDSIRKKGDDKLNIIIATPDIEEFQKTLLIIEKKWKEIGASVIEAKIPAHTDFREYINTNNNFDALLWGYEVSSRLELKNIWNSNINDSLAATINYGNSDINKLFKDLKETPDAQEKENVYNNIKELLIRDNPAVFLYSPDVLYIVPQYIKGVERKELIFNLSDRFFNIHKWYKQEEEIWKTLIPDHN